MKTDSLFYRLFQIRPQLFFELLSGSSQADCNYQFTSVEVKQLAFRIDGIFFPSSGNKKDPFYVVEVQFQPDEQLYSRIFSELFLYIKQYQPVHPWRVVVIYPTRSVERNSEPHFQPLLNLEQVRRIYLDELEEGENSPLGVRLVKLITSKETEVSQQAQMLLESVSREVNETKLRSDIIDLIESIMVYKFPKMSRKEIAAMLGVDDLKQTRFYQEVFTEGKQEGKLEAVSRMLDSGVELNTIAQWLDLPLEMVKKEANKKKTS
ncbi:Rpn family recombination-promoting nuclease/putative transposase [Euhalothece natronophila Z-M001]|uniref:Rpn family recombination-promoting nuclease/putative transposase n=1 Tax=Euhalothece natronophila Z-M001 TaxID=522448 RepID=A0A5B8NN19_9CHRO|nr:Rpn family recombination-promoting nuclease/putative transposase [Euhalothece natronophila Z-M001]